MTVARADLSSGEAAVHVYSSRRRRVSVGDFAGIDGGSRRRGSVLDENLHLVSFVVQQRLEPVLEYRFEPDSTGDQ